MGLALGLLEREGYSMAGLGGHPLAEPHKGRAGVLCPAGP